MRKKALKKMNPLRHKAFLKLRENRDSHEVFIDSRGNEVILNVSKRILLQKPYKNREYVQHIFRQTNEFRGEN